MEEQADKIIVAMDIDTEQADVKVESDVHDNDESSGEKEQ